MTRWPRWKVMRQLLLGMALGKCGKWDTIIIINIINNNSNSNNTKACQSNEMHQPYPTKNKQNRNIKLLRFHEHP